MSDGYVHDPESVEETDSESTETDDLDSVETEDGDTDGMESVHPDAVDREFDWRGWTLVGMIFVAFIVVPGIIFTYPHVGPMFGLTFWDTYLALPMIPALILGVMAVWATTRP